METERQTDRQTAESTAKWPMKKRRLHMRNQSTALRLQTEKLRILFGKRGNQRKGRRAEYRITAGMQKSRAPGHPSILPSIYVATAPSGPWSPVSLRRRLHSSPSSAPLLHPRIPRICDVALRTTSSHLVLGFPTGLLLRNFPLRPLFFGSGGASFHLPFSQHDPPILVF